MEKEQARVISQEMLAAGIYSMWIQTKAAKNAKPGQLYPCIQMTQVNYCRVRSVFVR